MMMTNTAVAVGEHLIPTVLNGRDVEIEALTYGVSTFLNDNVHIPVEMVEHTVLPMALDAELSREFELPVGHPALLVEAELKSRNGDALSAVALGRLVFNPARVTVSATGRPTAQ